MTLPTRPSLPTLRRAAACAQPPAPLRQVHTPASTYCCWWATKVEGILFGVDGTSLGGAAPISLAWRTPMMCSLCHPSSIWHSQFTFNVYM